MAVEMQRTVGRTCRRLSQQNSVTGYGKEEKHDSGSWQSVKPTVGPSLQYSALLSMVPLVAAQFQHS